MIRPRHSRLLGPWWADVDRASLRADALAGVLGALLVLPQAVAFASLAGLPPAVGLCTAIVPCAVAALAGSSRHVVSGPTNAISLALLATLAPIAVPGSALYLQLAVAVTLAVGLMQFAIGALRLGSAAHFVSPSALRGFTSGAALLIVVHSLPDVFGVPPDAVRGGRTVFEGWAQAPPSAWWPSTVVATVAAVTALAVRRRAPKLPALLIALAAGTVLAVAIERSAGGLGIAPVRVVGAVPSGLPSFAWPSIDWQAASDLLGIAFALTVVALGQSIGIAKALADRSGQQIDVNREFRGQGLSNIVGSLFSAYVSCGSLNRSMPNFDAGARTPLAAVFAAGALLLLTTISGPLLARVPLPAIAGLLVVIAVSLFDLPGWRRLAAESPRDAGIAAATLVATLTIRLEMAILLGTLLSLVAFLHRTSRPSMRPMGFDVPVGAESCGPSPRPFVVRADVPAPLPPCPQLAMVRMEGEVYFGAVAHVSDQLREFRRPVDAPRHLLVMAKSMNFIDLPAADLWRAELAARRAAGGDLYFHRPRPAVLELWRRIGFVDVLGADHVFPTKRAAIAAIFGRLDPDICARCTVRLYEECQRLPPPREG